MNFDYKKMSGRFDPITKVWEGVKIPCSYPAEKHVTEIVMDALKESPNRVVQICYDDKTEMTCGELRTKIIRLAQNLMKIGVKDEDVVGLVCENSMNLMVTVNGIYQVGAIVAAMSVIHCKEDLANVFKYSRPKVMICDADVYKTVKEAMTEIGNKAIFYTTKGVIPGVKTFEELLEPTGNEENYQVAKFKSPSNKILALLPSSGTTDHLKGICVSQSMFLNLIPLVPNETVSTFSFSGIFWGPAFATLVICAITKLVRIVSRKPFQPEFYMKAVIEAKVTHLILNPTMITMILNSPLFSTFDTSHVKLVTGIGGIISENLRDRMKKAFPKSQIMIFYSLNEISCAFSYPGQPIDDLTVGFVAPNHLMKIVDDDGKSLDLGETGEILVKFFGAPFLGYYNNPEATNKAVDSEGFVRTGDIGYIREDGFVYVIDRKKDIFKYNADHITPSEIESVIEQVEGVELVAVFGIPNAQTYNLPAALIKKRQGFEKLTENEIIHYVAAQMPEYKQLHGGVFFVEEMPISNNGKILRRKAKEIALKLYQENLSNKNSK